MVNFDDVGFDDIDIDIDIVIDMAI